MGKVEYEQVFDGQWWTLGAETLIQCCGCGMVHRVRTRLKDGVLQVQFSVENRRTGQVRRWRRRRGERIG